MSAPRAEGGAYAVGCPDCFSKPGQLCTAPDDRGRHPVRRTHYARETAYTDALEEERQDALRAARVDAFFADAPDVADDLDAAADRAQRP